MTITHDHRIWNPAQSSTAQDSWWQPVVGGLFGAKSYDRRPWVGALELAGEALMLVALVLVSASLVTVLAN